jgi:transposase
VRQYGRVGKDKDGKAQKLYANKTATKHKKTGSFAGYTKLPNKDNYLYIAPWVYNCNCDTVVFNTWLKKVFIPDVKLLQVQYPNNPITLIMDNVRYHKSKETKDLLEQHNVNLLFQPPYSPDLNPIEPSWDTTKNEIRNQSYTITTFQDKLFKSLNKRSWDG